MIRFSVAKASKKNKVLDAAMVAPGEEKTSAWLRPNDPLPDGVFALFPEKSADANLEKDVTWANAIDVDSVLIVRKSLTSQVFAPLVEAGEVVLRPAHVYRAHPSKKLGWNKGVLDDDFVFVDVRARFPADRAKLDPSAFEGAPYSSILEWVPKVEFGKDRAPRFSIFRVGDESSVLLATPQLFAALKKALGPAIEEGGSGPRFFLLDASSKPPVKTTHEAGAAAADAFYRMYHAGKSVAADRKLALASPIWAYWLALLVEREPADDTRAACCAHPHFAYAYARDVDRAPHVTTRKAVSKDRDAAREYAVHVDRAVHPSLRDALSYHAADVEIRAHENARRFAPKAATTTSETPEYQRVVFAPDGRGVVLGSLRTAGHDLYAPFDPWPKGVASFVAEEYGGKGRLRKQKSLAHLGALRDGNFGPIIVRRSAVTPLVEELGDEVALVRCTLHDARGKLDDDFAILEVKTYVPMDPVASEVKLAHPRAPWTGGVNLVHRFAWSSPPKPRIFRVREFPYVVLAAPALCAALAKATSRAVRGSTEAPAPEQMTALIEPPKKSPSVAEETAAAAAMSAFYKGDRKAALKHPQGALAVALAERKPAADTRKAVLSSPRIALEYALFVDRGPRPDTRAAAAKTSDTAYRYARHVDIGFTPATRKALDRKMWSEADIESFAEELATRRADLGRSVVKIEVRATGLAPR